MFIRLFQPRFAPLVAAGAKLQTIRSEPKRMPRPGDTISLRAWKGQPYRSKQRILREATITKVEAIELYHAGGDFRIALACGPLWPEEVLAFAQADGFAFAGEMRTWFEVTHGLPFTGIVIHWNAKLREPEAGK